MLNQMRSGANNFAAKVLLALLILSFAIWGIGDMVRHPGGNSIVATVDGVNISQRAFNQALKREMEAIRGSLGSNYSPEVVKQLGLPRQVLHKMINRTLIEREAAKLGLIPSDADVAQRIRNTGSFQTDKGKFNKELFLEILRRSNLSEKEYAAQLRNQMATELLMQVFNGNAPVPDSMLTAIYQAIEEQRIATLYTLSASSANSEPDETQIANYYKEHGSQFSTPEFRKISYITLKSSDIKKDVVVSDADMELAYNERIDEFKRPERRNVAQLLYDSEENAKKASDLLKAGKSVEQVAKDTNAQGKKPIAMENVTHDTIPDEAESVFSMKQGGSSEPIKTAFGWHIFHVTKIVPATTLSLAEARPTLEKDAKQRAIENAMSKLSNEIEDTLASGSSLAEVAKQAGLTVHTLPEIDARGNGKDGKPVKELPSLDKFLAVAFKTNEKTESSLTSSKGGESYILRVESITPEQVPPLEQIKTRIVDSWKKEQRAKTLADIAKTIELQFADEKTRADAVSKNNLKVSVSDPIKRTSENKTLPDGLLADLFERTVGKNTGMYMQANGDYVVAVVKEIIPSKATPPESMRAKLHDSIENSMKNELMEQYLDYLKTKHTVTINEDVLETATAE